MEKIQCPGYYYEDGRRQPAFPDNKVDVLVQELDGKLKASCPFLGDEVPHEEGPLCKKIPNLVKNGQIATGCPYSKK